MIIRPYGSRLFGPVPTWGIENRGAQKHRDTTSADHPGPAHTHRPLLFHLQTEGSTLILLTLARQI